MTSKIILFASAIAMASLSACSEAPKAEQAATAQSDSAGIKVGAAMPVSMPLADASGAATTLAQHMGTKGLVLIMVRSADWCPYCKAQMIEVSSAKAVLEQRGYKLVTLSYDDPATLSDFAKAKGLAYTMLSDKGSKLIDATGLRDPQYGADSKANGVPYPTLLIIGTDGMVKAKRVDTDYTVRPTNAEMIALVDDVKA